MPMAPMAAGPRRPTMTMSTTFIAIQPTSANTTGRASAMTRRASDQKAGIAELAGAPMRDFDDDSTQGRCPDRVGAQTVSCRL